VAVAKIPVACSLVGDAYADRLERWKQLLVDTATGRARTPNGLEINFTEQAAHTLAELVAAERECCGWAEWDLSHAPGVLILRVTASDPAGAEVLGHLFQI
jgi:hypothetical protein